MPGRSDPKRPLDAIGVGETGPPDGAGLGEVVPPDEAGLPDEAGPGLDAAGPPDELAGGSDELTDPDDGATCPMPAEPDGAAVGFPGAHAPRVSDTITMTVATQLGRRGDSSGRACRPEVGGLIGASVR